MTNVMQAYAKYKDEQTRKITEFKFHISNVIDEFMNATEEFTKRDDLTDLFIEWDYMASDDHFIYISGDEADEEMLVWEQTSRNRNKNKYLYTYDSTVFKELNSFLEKNFPWTGFKIKVYAYLSVADNTIELEFIPRKDIVSIIPAGLDKGSYLRQVCDGITKLLERTGAEVDSNYTFEIFDNDVKINDAIEDACISAIYNLDIFYGN